ncbi:DUF4012 domain-containing protein [Galbitalea sp. SE-J8]|uniref:DUF4012 domain-containing protein n=1 Tax=Galbitalea sp. SE-J8 TaxID=3054952 RepID=UPI00259D1C0A|nr:DUF4012 domain-containing protein [Galbitalea sp. SE-J8]MDM4763869.1 DUF4012 domain-containing protein [Galbitalea sp. SE-J8]
MALLVIAGSVVSFRVSTLAGAFATFVSYASVTKQHAANADLDVLAKDVEHLDDLAHDMLNAATDPVISAASGAPFIGDYLAATRTLAAATVQISTAARPLAELLPELDTASVSSGGHYNVDALRRLDTRLTDLNSAIGVASTQIDSVDTTGLDSRVVSAIDSLTSALGGVQQFISSSQPLLAMLPILLGTDGTWFVGLQNLAEARGTGGLLGAFSVLSTKGGTVTQTASGSDLDLIPVPISTAGLSSDYLDIWGDQLTEWRSLNSSADFPDTGRMVSNVWKTKTGTELDGVVSFGQGTVPYLLAATGPIDVDGTTVDASNVIQFLTLDVYAKYPDFTDKNAIVGHLVQQIFARLQSGQFDFQSLFAGGSFGATHDRVQLWSPHAEVESEITAAGLDGALSSAYGPDVYVALNNSAGSKIDQFIDVAVDYELGTCNPTDEWSEEREAKVTVTVTNNAPTSGLPEYVDIRADREETGAPYVRGSNADVISVYGPVGSYENETTLDGETIGGYVGDENDRPLYAVNVDLDPGQSSTLVIDWNEPTIGDDITDVLSAQPSVQFAPSIRPWSATTPAAPVCPAS